jgi:hypothetical protein
MNMMHHATWPPRRVYVASKARYFCWWEALKACGLPIVCSWISWERNIDGQNPTADEWSRHSDRCFREAADADILLLYCNDDDERHFGSLLEAGAALAGGAMIYRVAPHPWDFLRHHPRVRTFPSLASAVTAIMAAATPDLCAGAHVLQLVEEPQHDRTAEEIEQ